MKNEIPRQREGGVSEAKTKTDGDSSKRSEASPRSALREEQNSSGRQEKGGKEEPPAKESKGNEGTDARIQAGTKYQSETKAGSDPKNETSQARGAETRPEGKPESKVDPAKEANSSGQREAGARDSASPKEAKGNERTDLKAEPRGGDKVEAKANDPKCEISPTLVNESRAEGKPEAKVDSSKELNSSGQRETGARDAQSAKEGKDTDRTDARSELRSGNKGSDSKNDASQVRGAETRAEGKPEAKIEQHKDKDASNSAPEHEQASARDGSPPDRSSSERACSKEERPTLEQTANFERLKSAIETHNWKNELSGKVHVFWSGQDRRTAQETESWADSSKRGIGKNEQYYPQGSNWTSAQEQARVFVAERPDSNSRERIMLDQTAMGAEISKAERSLTKEQAQALWTQASECFAKSAVANFEDHKIPCMIFGRNAVADRTLIKNEFPILEKGKCDTFSDQSGRPSENKLDLGSWTTPQYKH